MSKELIVSSSPHETKVAILEDDQLAEVYFERPQEHTIAGSIYKGKVKRVLPGMQSAFVDIGLERDAFLYVSDFFEDIEEYDKIVTGVEEKVARMDQESSAVRVRAGDTAAPPRAAVPAAPPAGAVESPAPPAAAPAGPGENGARAEEEPHDRDRGRRRRSRRRRFRDRGFPESKYASRTEMVVEPRPRAEAKRPPEEIVVLPGESLAKYRRSAPESGADEALESAESEAAAVEEPAESLRVEQLQPDSGLSESAGIEATAEEHGSSAELQPAAPGAHASFTSEAAETRQPPSRAEKPAGERPVRPSAEALELHHPEESGPVDVATERQPEAAREDKAPEPQSQAHPPANQPHGEAGPADPPQAEEAGAVKIDADIEPEPLHAAGRTGEPPAAGESEALPHLSDEAVREPDAETHPTLDEDRPPEAEDSTDQTQLGPFASPVPEQTLPADVPVAGRAAVKQEPEEPASEASVRGPAGPARFTQRLSRRMRRKLREQKVGAKVVERPERLDRPERPERAERLERPERAERPERPERPERAERGDRGQPLISDLLREGQEIIVQIAKEPLGKKGARITSHVALPGRFVVYMPTVDHVGVSRRISSDDERQRLKRIIQEERRDISGGFIVRTAADGCSEEDLKQDIRFLSQLWLDIRAKAERKNAPALLHHDLDLIERILRDQLSESFSAIWVDNEQEYASILEFVQHFQPSLVSRVKLYTKETSIFEQFNVQDEINKALKPKVWLKSGGYIVINQTEALVAIDVNTGKYVGKTQRLEDTIVKTNVDAIKEIVRQIRLRDLGGIIVIDFIDMDERKNRARVMQALEEALRGDRAPSKILAFNDFGLVAITRKRVKQSLERTLCAPCTCCGGSGFLKSPHTVAMEILAEAAKLVPQQHQRKEITLRVHPDVARYLKQRDVTVVQEIEEMTHRPVLIKSDSNLHVEGFDFN